MGTSNVNNPTFYHQVSLTDARWEWRLSSWLHPSDTILAGEPDHPCLLTHGEGGVEWNIHTLKMQARGSRRRKGFLLCFGWSKADFDKKVFCY